MIGSLNMFQSFNGVKKLRGINPYAFQYKKASSKNGVLEEAILFLDDFYKSNLIPCANGSSVV